MSIQSINTSSLITDTNKLLRYVGDRFIPSRKENHPKIDINQMKYAYYARNHIKVIPIQERIIPVYPTLALDAKGLISDFYANIIDWGYNDVIIVALGKKICSYNYKTKKVTSMDSLLDRNIFSIKFSNDGCHYSVGSRSIVAIYDFEREKRLRTFQHEDLPIYANVWTSNFLTVGVDKDVLIHDIRVKDSLIRKISNVHTSFICNVQWDASMRYIASGGNDDTLKIMDIRMSRVISTLNHTSAVKAFQWDVSNSDTIISGGGISDKTLRFWNVNNGKIKDEFITDSQITSLKCSKIGDELVITQGYTKNNILVFKYPKLKCIKKISGAHQDRILYCAQSPDGTTICTGSSDESIKIWKMFNYKKKQEDPFIHRFEIR